MRIGAREGIERLDGWRVWDYDIDYWVIGYFFLGYFNFEEGNKVNCILLLFIYLFKLG